MDSSYMFDQSLETSNSTIHPEIKDNQVVKALIKETEQLTKETIYRWYEIVLKFGSGNSIENRISKLQQKFSQTCQKIIDEIDAEHQALLKNTEILTERYIFLTNELGFSIFQPDDNMGLEDVEQYLSNKVAEYENELKQRRAELDGLLTQYCQLTSILGVAPKYSLNCAIPSSNEMEKLRSAVEQLEQEKFNREEKFMNLKIEISEMFNKLNRYPQLDFERKILSKNDTTILLDGETIARMEKLHREMKNDFKRVLDEIQELRNKIDQIWDQLDVDILDRDQFRNRHSEENIKTLHALQRELQRCKKVKEANIKLFVQKARHQLEEIWDKCYCTIDTKACFRPFHISDSYNEDLLEIHERELCRWKEYYENNKELFSLLATYESYLKKRQEIEVRSENRNTYKNRGGELLKEEKERNKIIKATEKTKARILQLNEIYCNREIPVLIHNKTIKQFIQEKTKEYEMDRKLRLSAKKSQREQMKLTPGKPGTSTFLSRATPSSSVRKLMKPQTPVAVRKNLQSLFVTPKPPEPKNLPASKVPKVVGSKLNSSRKRRSSGLLKARKQIHKNEKGNIPSASSSVTSDYESFANDLSSKQSCRSTTFRDVIPLVVIEDVSD